MFFLSKSNRGPNKYMRLRVKIDFTMVLKKWLNLKQKSKENNWVNLHYERLLMFCFKYGIIGYGERFCKMNYENKDGAAPQRCGPKLWAQPKKAQQLTIGSRWLCYSSLLMTTMGNDDKKKRGNNSGEKSSEATIPKFVNQGSISRKESSWSNLVGLSQSISKEANFYSDKAVPSSIRGSIVLRRNPLRRDSWMTRMWSIQIQNEKEWAKKPRLKKQ